MRATDLRRSIERAAENVRSWPQWKQDLIATRRAAKAPPCVIHNTPYYSVTYIAHPSPTEPTITNDPLDSLHLPPPGLTKPDERPRVTIIHVNDDWCRVIIAGVVTYEGAMLTETGILTALQSLIDFDVCQVYENIYTGEGVGTLTEAYQHPEEDR